MKRAIVIILVILLVAGGGAGGLIMMGIVPNPFTPTPQGGPLTDAELAAQKVVAKKFQGPSVAYKLVKVADMTIPVIMNGQASRRVFVTARLMVDRPQNESSVVARLGVYQDAVLSDLVPFLQEYYRTHDAIDAKMTKARMMATARKVYGEMVVDVIMVNVFDQENNMR
jgi:hypothetical protein